MHNLINMKENLDSAFACKTAENEEENKLFLAVLEESIS